jgi:hypothetical protein
MKTCACVSMTWSGFRYTRALRARPDTLVLKVLLDLRGTMVPPVSMGHKALRAPRDPPGKMDTRARSATLGPWALPATLDLRGKMDTKARSATLDLWVPQVPLGTPGEMGMMER